MNIIYLTEERISFSGTLVRGGQIHVRNVVSALRDRGHDVHLVDWNDTQERPFQHSLSPSFRFGVDPIRTVFQAVPVGRDIDVDIIISKTRKTYFPGLIAAGILNVPHVVHVGSDLGGTANGPLNRFSAASFAARLRAPHDAYLVVCDTIADSLVQRGIDGERVFDVKNAVDTDRFNSNGPPRPLAENHRQALPDDDAFRLGFVGGLYEYKGLADLAMALARTTTDCQVFIAGDGPAKERFERLFGDSGTFLGSIPYNQIPAFYHAIDAFVLPSHTEGLPRVVLEAQATATPVVATRVGGVPEVITDGETGLLCDPHDPDGLSTAIDRLALDESDRDRVGHNGRDAVVEKFTWERLYDRYERSLKTVCE
jgi:starch synthase